MSLTEWDDSKPSREDLVEPDGCRRCDDVPVTHLTTASGQPLCGACAQDAVEMFGEDAVESIQRGDA